MTTIAARPIKEKDRIASLDVLRGFALLGILPMNIQYFSMTSAAYSNPMAYGDLHGANLLVWLLCRVLADEKFTPLAWCKHHYAKVKRTGPANYEIAWP